MTYIDYSSLSPVQRLQFNTTGECPAEHIMTEAQFLDQKALLCDKYGVKINDDKEVKLALGIEDIDVFV